MNVFIVQPNGTENPSVREADTENKIKFKKILMQLYFPA